LSWGKITIAFVEISDLVKQLLHGSSRSWIAHTEFFLAIFFIFFSESFSVPVIVSKTINLLNYIFLGYMILRLWKRMAYLAMRDWGLIALVGLAVSSILWSVDADYSLRESIGMIRTTLFGIYLATAFSFCDQLKLFAWVSIWAVAVNLVACIVFPTFGIQPDPNQPGELAFVGIYPYKQILGRIMVLSLITLLINFWRVPRQRWLSGLGVLGAMFLLFGSRSSTYVIAATIAIGLVPLYLIAKQRIKVRMILVTVTLFIGVVGASLFLVSWESLVASSSKGLTFNGRTPIWTLAFDQLMQRPFLGYGYSAFWGSDEGWQVYRGVPWVWSLHKPEYDVRTFIAHNAFLDVALQLGLVGLAMLGSHIVLVLARAIVLMLRSPSLESFWMLQILAIQIVGACFEISTYLVGNSSSWVMYVALAYASAGLLHRDRQQRRAGTIAVLD
jgi:exopolysaccharide production protein ExoQ